MKKGQMYSGLVTEVKFPNKGIVRVEAVCASEDGKCVPASAEFPQNTKILNKHFPDHSSGIKQDFPATIRHNNLPPNE